MKEYQKAQIHDIETNSNTKNIRNVYMEINYFKKGYQSRTNIVKDENGDLVTDSHSILTRWGYNFSLTDWS